jgi:hypothetical protein
MALCTTTSASAQLGTYAEGNFSALFGSLEWEPDCETWWPSYYARQDADALRRAVNSWTDCVERQARNDAQVAVRAIQNGREQAVQEKLAELRRY